MQATFKQLTYRALVCSTLGATAASAVAADAPPTTSSGSLLRNNPILNAPANPRSESDNESALGGAGRAAVADAEQGERFRVTHIEVDDVPEALQPVADAVLAPYRDQDMTFGMLRNIAVKVTVALQDAGERVSYVYIPDQDVIDGVVRLKLLRGFIESAKLGGNTSLVSDRVLQQYLDRGVSPSGDVPTLENQLLRLSDLPGVGGTTPVLAAGEQPGGSALTLGVAAGDRVEAVAVADNAGSKTSGRWRVGTQIGVNSPLGIGDRFQMVAYTAPAFLQPNHDSDSGNTLIGRLSYDLPVGAAGARAGLSFSKVRYALGGALRDTGDGFAEVYGVYGSYPLLRSATQNLNLSANLEYKRLSDNVAKQFTDITMSRSATVLSAQVAGDRQGQIAGLPNVMQYQLGLSAGKLRTTPFWDIGGGMKGKYYKATQNLRLSQALARGMYLDLALSGQQASRNLDGSEKMPLGGPNGVRAYSNDAASVDRGWVLMPTLNVALPKVDGLTAQLFYDYARGAQQKSVNGANTTVSIAGYGAGLNYVLPKRASINLSYGQRHGADSRLLPQARDMVWLSTTIRF